MHRFLTLVGIATVAGAMYVAAAPGGLRSTGPSTRQFKALKTTVAKLQKEVGQVKKLSQGEAVILVECLLHKAQAVDELGAAGTSGYLFGPPGTPPGSATATTALDLAPTSETSSQFYFLAVSPSCQATINSNSTGVAAFHGKAAALHQLLALAGSR